MNSDVILKLGSAAIVLGLFRLFLAAGLPDLVLVAIGFAVAALALGLGVKLRPDE